MQSIEQTGTSADQDIAVDFLAQFDGDASKAIAAVQRAAALNQTKTRPAKSVVSADAPVVVRIENITKTYKLGRQKVEALKDVSLSIQQGEFVAITGSSGSGKSTLLQLIGGLDKPSSGTINVDGHDLSRLSDRKLSTFRNKTVGFVFQFFYLQPFLKLRVNLEVPGMFARTKQSERMAKSTELANAVGLNERLNHLPKELSGGQMQRAAIARALLNQPKILLADEPTGNLDSANGNAIIELFETIRRDYGTTIIVVTHDAAIAKRADREITMKDGVVTA
jgi:putative ABC transport system ATP-binding protein